MGVTWNDSAEEGEGIVEEYVFWRQRFSGIAGDGVCWTHIDSFDLLTLVHEG